MNWIDRHGVHFCGPYRLCRTTRGEWDVWYYASTHNGVLKRGFQNLSEAKDFALQHEGREEFLKHSLDAVAIK